jgi:phosphate transport system protein
MVVMPHHIVKTFDEDLEQLGRKVEEMGHLVQKHIADAVDALTRCDVRIGEKVLTGDDAIDAIQHEIEEKAVLTMHGASRWPLTCERSSARYRSPMTSNTFR